MDRIRHASRLGLAVALLLSSGWKPPDAALATEAGEPPPYRTRHFDLVDLPFDRLPWTNDPPPLLPAQPPVDENGIRLYRREDGKLHYRPGSIAISGLKRIDAYRDTGDRAQLDQALVQARHLRASMLVRDDAWWVPFWFDYPPERLKAPWYNAMAQGLVLSFFVRLYRVTGDAIHLHAAGKVFDSFLRLGQVRPGAVQPDPVRPWVSYVDERDYLWLEHYPVARPDHTLNVHLHALIGIYEYWQATRSPEARGLLEGALTTMRDRAGRYRREGRVERLRPAQPDEPLQLPRGAHLAASAARPHDRRPVLHDPGRHDGDRPRAAPARPGPARGGRRGPGPGPCAAQRAGGALPAGQAVPARVCVGASMETRPKGRTLISPQTPALT